MALALTAASFSFAPAAVPALRAPAASLSNVVCVERSQALPFLKKPPALDGTMAGDVGFDPLGFSTTITELGGDLKYVREAELMHGRQSMLAVVGFFWPSTFGQLIAGDYSANPLQAQYELPSEVLAQVVVSVFIAESLRAQIVYRGDREPGEHFGAELTANLIKTWKLDTPEAMMAMKTKEIKHCRLAMIAITGIFFQQTLCNGVWPVTL